MKRARSLAAGVAGLLLFAAPVSAQTIYPIDRASFLAGTRFDFKVEFPSVVAAGDTKITINGRDYLDVLKGQASYLDREDGGEASSALVRGASLPAGSYTVTATAGGKSQTVTWEVFDTPATPRAKNVILFIGDGMTVANVTAARMLSKTITQGKYNGRLTIDMFPYNAMVGTSGQDSIVTDSANSAHAYTTGHKSAVNALGVYASRAKSNLDHPRVETIAEFIKRTSKKSVGVVTNTEIEDATPASMVAHTRRRSDYDVIVNQFFDLQPDVIMGGGSSNFIPKSVAGSRRTDEQDYLQKFKSAGYAVATTNTELQAAGAQSATKLLGLFHPRNMDGALDRRFLKVNTVKQFPDQPDLTDQVRAAIQVLDRNPDGFMLMVESGLIDKFNHPLDWERSVYDTIMLDNAVKVAVDWAAKREDTLILVIADHTHGMGIFGTVNDQVSSDDMRDRVGTYDKSGWPNYPAPDADGYPPSVDVSRRLMIGYAAYPDHYETFRPKLDGTFVPAIQGADKKFVANEKYKVPGAILVPGNIGYDDAQGVHTADDVVLRAWGPGADMARGFLDNTEIFRIMAVTMALGHTGG